MARYVVDTTFLIDYLRDDPVAIERFRRFFEEGDNVLVNEIVVCEARVGLTAAQVPELMSMLLPLEFIQPGPEAALNAGRWRDESRRAGRVLSLGDALIAAAADASDAIVLTRNVRDFAQTPVRVESY
ncbi:MAG: PIN domain-containing protein [Chloroflexota bacterium]